MDISISERSSDVRPIFMTRLVDDSGCSITGGAAHVGNDGVALAMRSETSWRALSRSAPGAKRSTIEDSCSTDLERISSSPSTPLRASSSGTVTSSSTSDAVRPMQMVWISTFGGANSGKTSTEAVLSWTPPNAIIATAMATTKARNFRLNPTIRRMSMPLRTEFGAKQFRCAHGDNVSSRRRTGPQLDHVTGDPIHGHCGPDVGPRLRIGVNPGLAVRIVDQCAVRHFQGAA